MDQPVGTSPPDTSWRAERAKGMLGIVAAVLAVLNVPAITSAPEGRAGALPNAA
jgi:hypothetical protein